MALVKFSMMISEIRNKLNGSVFARNRGGNYIRNKVTPINKKSSAQVLARSRLTQFAQAWKGLTENQRKAWNAATSQWARTNVFGDVVNPSGNALFNRLNINLALAGQAQISVPPLPIGADAVTSLSIVANATNPELTLTFTPAAVPAGHSMYVESTENLSPGIFNANAKYRHIATLAPLTATGEDVIVQQTEKFAPLVVGQKVFVRVKFINQATGEVSQALNASAIAV